MAIAFFMPVVSLIGDVHHSGGGLLRYAAGIPCALAIGATIIFAEWHMLDLLFLQLDKHRSKLVGTTISISSFLLFISSIVVGAIAGSELAAFLTSHVQ